MIVGPGMVPFTVRACLATPSGETLEVFSILSQYYEYVNTCLVIY